MEKVIQIATEIVKNNGYCYVNGGYVRDRFLGIPSKDIDVEVYNITPETLFIILSKFGQPKLVGKSFGVFKLDEYDFSLPRRERKTGSKHTEFEIECDPYMNPKDACLRRDLTINALLMDPFTNFVHDYYGGIDDLMNKRIKHVSEKFSEDPLRVIRVARFASKLNFSVHDDTRKLCESLLCELQHLPKERFFSEFESILLKAPMPSIAFEFLRNIGVIESYFPELDVLQYIEQGDKYHKEGSVWIHTMLALDQIPIEDRTLELMFAILCHDMGKAIVKTEDKGEGHISFKHHAEDGVKPAERFMRSLTNEEKLITDVLNLVYHHMRPYDLTKELHKKTVRKLATKIDIPLLMKVNKADRLGRYNPQELSSIDRILEVYEEVKNEIKPLIQGKDLIEIGMKPGKHFSPILKQIFDLQLDGEFSTVEEGIKLAKDKKIL